MDREAALSRIVAVLKPYLGATMAEAATRTHCEKLGLAAGIVTPEQLEALVGRLATGLAVFVGREKTTQVVAEIRQALAAPGGGA